MSNNKKKVKDDWPAIIFLLIVLPFAFTLGGVWVGIVVLILGVVALGWSKRHKGPFPTNRTKE
jgi:predicted membrane protein